jgi:hypothetical protein
MHLMPLRSWLGPGLLVLASPVFAILPFLVVAFLALLLQPVSSLDEWLNTEPFKRSIGFAIFASVLSIDAVLRAFYWTLPVMFMGARTVANTDFGFQSKAVRLAVSALSVGVLYVVMFNVGTYFGWLDKLFWT